MDRREESYYVVLSLSLFELREKEKTWFFAVPGFILDSDSGKEKKSFFSLSLSTSNPCKNLKNTHDIRHVWLESFLFLFTLLVIGGLMRLSCSWGSDRMKKRSQTLWHVSSRCRITSLTTTKANGELFGYTGKFMYGEQQYPSVTTKYFIYIYIYIYMYIKINIYMKYNVYIKYIYIYINVYIYKYIYEYINIYIYEQIYIYTICIYKYIYIYNYL